MTPPEKQQFYNDSTNNIQSYNIVKWLGITEYKTSQNLIKASCFDDNLTAIPR